MRYQQLEHKPFNATAKLILKGAYELFLKKGYKNVTTREIAAHVGVNLGLIAYYFSSKEQLGAMVLDYINENIYEKAFKTELPEDVGEAERLCIYTGLLWRYTDENVYRITFELTDFNATNIRMSQPFKDLAWDVIQAYHLSVTSLENEMYLTVFKSSELALLRKMMDHELNITWDDIFNILLSNYFFNIGLPDQTILSVLKRSKELLEDIPQSQDLV